MKKLLVLILCLQMLLFAYACTNGSDNKKTTTESTDGITATEPEITTPETTTPEGTTTPEETTTPESTTEPYVPVYEDGGFTYQIDVKPYLQYICTGGNREYLVIANRKHPLGAYYTPNDLVYVMSGSTWLLRRAAKEAFEAMRLEMQKLGVYDTYNRSTYRSYSFQNTLYYKYLEQERKNYPHLSNEELINIVDTYSARPGTSDHQTGLTIDFNPLDNGFANLKAFKYMKDNAHKFGFILRYPQGKTYITGYTYEPWHWRFVGREAATYIYENDLTLEEYMAILDGTTLETFPETTPIPPITKPPVTSDEDTEPDTSEPDTSTVDTDPEITSPEDSDPDITDSDITDPDITDPDSTDSDSVPEDTEPDSTEPDSAPEDTEPDTSEPDTSEKDTDPESTTESDSESEPESTTVTESVSESETTEPEGTSETTEE